VIATDDDRVGNVAKRFGAEVVMTSSDIQSGSDRVAAVAETIDGHIFVNIQGDEPLIDPHMIDEGVATVASNPGVMVGTLVRRIQDARDLNNPGVVKVVVDRNGDAMYFSRSPIPYLRDVKEKSEWVFREVFYKHLGLYVFRREFLDEFGKLPASRLEQAERLEQLRILEAGYRIRTAVTEYDSIPVDTADDVDLVLKRIQR
jgi:3-deoxy-manno-octulosonate cytidylyltransferase (CMP-KDO synthetase)